MCFVISERDDGLEMVDELEEKLLRYAAEIDHLEDKIANLEAQI